MSQECINSEVGQSPEVESWEGLLSISHLTAHVLKSSGIESSNVHPVLSTIFEEVSAGNMSHSQAVESLFDAADELWAMEVMSKTEYFDPIVKYGINRLIDLMLDDDYRTRLVEDGKDKRIYVDEIKQIIMRIVEKKRLLSYKETEPFERDLMILNFSEMLGDQKFEEIVKSKGVDINATRLIIKEAIRRLLEGDSMDSVNEFYNIEIDRIDPNGPSY